jgi:hydrogenase expression/formation protein HypC
MCIGVPMQVEEVHDGWCLCGVDGQTRRVSTLLLDAPPAPGDHVLVHADTAVRAMSAEEAVLVADALRAVMAAASGQDFEHLIADLADREPQLPDHLRSDPVRH